MTNDYVYPEARAILFDLIDGRTFAGHTVNAAYVLDIDFEESMPWAQIYVERGTTTYVDRTDWVAVNVYAAPGDAVPIAEAISKTLANKPHNVAGVGFIDDVVIDQVPQDIPLPSDIMMEAQTIYRVVSRPQVIAAPANV